MGSASDGLCGLTAYEDIAVNGAGESGLTAAARAQLRAAAVYTPAQAAASLEEIRTESHYPAQAPIAQNMLHEELGLHV